MTHTVVQADALEFLRAQPDRSVALAFFSPPYEDQRTYGLGFRRKGQAWVDWLRPIIAECCRVSNGLCCVNMAAKVEGGRYSAAVEWLVADLTRLDGVACGPSPYAWVKSENYDGAPGNGMLGSGGPRYQRRDWEPVYAFCLPDRLPLAWTDNTAFGKPPKYDIGGEVSYRTLDGTRVNDRKKKKVTTMQGGTSKNGGAGCPQTVQRVMTLPEISNPGNVLQCSDVLRVPVGGGKLGCDIAHEGEAPMALGVAERFVCWFCPPGETVIDPFAGTGTTGHACKKHGRGFLGCDLRQSQVELSLKRLAAETPPLFA